MHDVEHGVDRHEVVSQGAGSGEEGVPPSFELGEALMYRSAVGVRILEGCDDKGSEREQLLDQGENLAVLGDPFVTPVKIFNSLGRSCPQAMLNHPESTVAYTKNHFFGELTS
jgi:hypothetical protein